MPQQGRLLTPAPLARIVSSRRHADRLLLSSTGTLSSHPLLSRRLSFSPRLDTNNTHHPFTLDIARPPYQHQPFGTRFNTKYPYPAQLRIPIPHINTQYIRGRTIYIAIRPATRWLLLPAQTCSTQSQRGKTAGRKRKGEKEKADNPVEPAKKEILQRRPPERGATYVHFGHQLLG